MVKKCTEHFSWMRKHGIEDARKDKSKGLDIEGKIEKEDFIKEYSNPNNYKPQTRKSNRGHKYE